MTMFNIKIAEDGFSEPSKKLLPYHIQKYKWEILDWVKENLNFKKKKAESTETKEANSQNEADS